VKWLAEEKYPELKNLAGKFFMYIDLITKIKNAQQAKKEKIKVPYSNMDMAILEVLAKYGYVGELAKKGRMPKRVIEIKLMYEDGLGVIGGVKIISKPSIICHFLYKPFSHHCPIILSKLFGSPFNICLIKNRTCRFARARHARKDCGRDARR